MEEITRHVTECCGTEMVEGVDKCPFCGARHPIVVKSEPCYRCERCGYRKT